MNIRNKLTLQFSAIVAFLLAIVLLSIYYISLLNTRSEFFDRLEDRAFISAKFFLGQDELTKEKFEVFEKKYLQSLPSEVIQIYNADNELQFVPERRDLHFTDKFLNTVRQEKKIRMQLGKQQLLGLHYRDNAGDYIIIATAVDKYGNSKMEDLRLVMLISYVLSLLVIYLSGRFFAKKALEPMEDVVHQVQQITASNLNLRVGEGNGKDEIAELAITFNRMLERLEHAFDMQRTFVSNASHELRTPLSIIISEIEVLLSRSRTEQEYRKAVEAVQHEAEQLNILVTTLLNFAKAGDVDNESLVDQVRLDELLWEIAEDARRKHPGTPVQLDMHNLPMEADSLGVPGSQRLLFSAFSNILDNAIKFSNGKTVECKLDYMPDKITIDITDKGIGISDKDLKNLFQPFFRAGNARSYQGHGLGLALTQRIIRLHGGNISVHSKEGQGTTFRVEFAHL